MFGCYFNSLNGIADKKDGATAERSTKLVEFGKWTTTIEGYKAQADQIPQPKDYVYTTETEYTDRKTALENASKKVERECDPTYIRKSIDRDKAQTQCDTDRTAEGTARTDFNAASVNYGYTKARQDFATAIANAEAEQKKLGIKPSYMDGAAGRLAKKFPWLFTEEGLIDLMPMLFAFLADIGFTFVPPLTMFGVDRRFKRFWGERWWESKQGSTMPVVYHPEPVVRPTPQVAITPTLEAEPSPESPNPDPGEAPTLEVEPSPQIRCLPPPKKPKREDYVVIVLAWKKGVVFTDQGEKHTSTDLHLMCADFCADRGFPVPPVSIFGSILKNEGKLAPKMINGKGYYRVRARPQMELVSG